MNVFKELTNTNCCTPRLSFMDGVYIICSVTYGNTKKERNRMLK